MFNKFIKVFLLIVLALSFSTMYTVGADASANKVMWGKTELKLGQIGKVTVLERTQLVKPTSDGKYESVRTLYPGDEFRVYQYKGQNGGLYGVGGGMFILKDSNIKYETPSKAKLKLITDFMPEVTPPNKENKDYVQTGQYADMVGKTNVSTEKIKNAIPEGYALLGFDNSAIVRNGNDTILNYWYSTDEYVKENYYPNSYFYNNKVGFSNYNFDKKEWETYLNIIHSTLSELGLQVSKSELKKELELAYNDGRERRMIGDAIIINFGSTMRIIWNDK